MSMVICHSDGWMTDVFSGKSLVHWPFETPPLVVKPDITRRRKRRLKAILPSMRFSLPKPDLNRIADDFFAF